MGFGFDDLVSVATLGSVDINGAPQPGSPDYVGAANATAAGNLAAAEAATAANRVNQTTPWGTSTWTAPTAEGDPWSQTTTLSPDQQSLLNTQTQTDQLMGDTALAGLTAAQDIFKTPYSIDGQAVSYSGPGTFGDNRQSVMDAMLARVDTQNTQDVDAARSQLIAQGIAPGSEAYDREMTLLNEKNTDARQQAEIAATDQAVKEYSAGLAGSGQEYTYGQDSNRQQITQDLLERQTPLNELNALRTGTQVQSPEFASVPQQQTTLGADILGATTAEGNWNLAGWNADQAQNNALLGGIFQLGGAAVAASDIRLKKNIKKVGNLPSGLPVYHFSYIGSDERFEGVMAQDVLKVFPEAVLIMPNGYYAVNYAMVS